MATRIPLILNQITARIEELGAADQLPGSAIAGLLGKNSLINGDMRVRQRQSLGNVANAAPYTSDRWRCSYVGSGTSNWGIGTHVVGEVPDARFFLGFNVVTPVTSAWIGQHIEGVETFAGRRVTVSFYMRSGVAGKKVGVMLQQLFGTGGSSLVVLEGDVITLSTAFQKFTVSFDVPSISGKIIGTNDNLLMVFFLADGTQFGGQLAGQSGLFELSRVQLEEGPVATAFEVRPRGLELLLCQRYYEKSYDVDVAPGAAGSTAGSAGSSIRTAFLLTAPVVNFAVPKRATPAVNVWATQSGASGQYSEYDPGSTFVANRACSAVNASTRNFEMVISGGSGVVGNTARFNWASDAEI